MSWIPAVTLLAAIAILAAASSSRNIICFSQLGCNQESAVDEVLSMEDCCRRGVQPFGLSYSDLVENQTRCFSCSREPDSNQGIEFVLGFIDSGSSGVRLNNPQFVLFISTQDPRGADVLVEIPRAVDEFAPMTFHINQFEKREVEFPQNISVRFGDQHDLGIHVVSENHEAKLNIIGLNRIDGSVATFLALPCVPQQENYFNVSEYKYYIFHFDFDYLVLKAGFLMIPCTTGSANKNSGIQYTIPGEATRSVRSLSQYETFLVSSDDDLTGTIIASPFPLAVFSSSSSGTPHCYITIEQIPPDIVYGTKFFVLPFSNFEINTIRIGSTIDYNLITITCNRRERNGSSQLIRITETISSGELFKHKTTRVRDDYNLAENYRYDFCYIESRWPAIVMQFSYSILCCEHSMALVPPVQQYRNDYLFETSSIFPSYFYISWAITTEFFDPSENSDNFFVNNMTFAPSNQASGDSGDYIPFYCNNGEICGYGGTGLVGSRSYLISYESSNPLAAVYVLFYDPFGLRIPAGMDLKPIGLFAKEEIGNVMVHCFRSHTCDSEDISSFSTMDDCCKHGVYPFGLAFKYNGTETCIECLVEFGFALESFAANESVSVHQVGFAFFSGRRPSDDFLLTLQYNAGTAVENSDVSLPFTRVNIPQVVEQDELQITSTDILFRLDPVAQEANETFTLTFSFVEGILGRQASLRNIFEGFVVDATVATFEISEECYRVREGENGNIPVIITKSSDIILANPVSFKVIPLTIDQAKEMELNLVFQQDNQHSPIYADEDDFNSTIIAVTFLAEEGSIAIADLSVPITVFDDDIDEANNQFFAVALEIFSAINNDLIFLRIRASLCEIVDNDPITIGFQCSVYDYYEPVTGHVEIMNVTIVKEDDRVSEQTFGLAITFGDPGSEINAATLQQADRIDFDYVVSETGINTVMTLFKPTQNEANFSFTIVSDNLAEGTEGLRVLLSSQGEKFPKFMLPSEEEMSPYSLALIRIIDADNVVAGFEELVYTANETDDLKVCVFLTTRSENTITLEYSIDLSISMTNATADNSDFTNKVETVTFVRRATSTSKKCIEIELVSDKIFELSESFFVNLNTTEQSSGIILSNSRSEVFILDNSEVNIGFSKEQYYLLEGENHEITIMNANRLQHNITITLELTAQSDSDFDSSNLTFTINFEKPNVSVLLIDDNIFEVDEYFQARLILPKNNVYSGLITISNSTLIIIEDDDMLEFRSDSAIFESDEVQNLNISLNAGDIEDLLVIVTVAINDSAGNATVEDDYTQIQPTSLNFTKNELSHNIFLYIENDEEPEKQEYFEVIIMNVTVIDSMGTESDISNEIGGRIRMNGITVIEDRVTLKTIVVCYTTPQCESDDPENTTLENCCTQQSIVLNFYYKVPGSLLSKCQPCQIDTPTETNIDTPTETNIDDGAVQPSSSNVLEISIGVVFGVIFIIALILVIILLCIFIARRFRRKGVDENRNLQLAVVGDEAKTDDSEYLRHYTVSRSSLKSAVPKKFIVPSCRLKLVSTIGQGEFGIVYKAHIKSGYLDSISDTVAVKTLKGFVEKESVRNLLKECGRMYTFDHPNVLKLIGVCMDGGPAPYIIMPFMENGSLKDYLKKERENFLLSSDCTDSELVVAVKKNLLDMCSQVAKGMEYLASKRIVHRDLAARNCMIDLNFVIRVADFGLAESLDSSKDYFRQDQDNVVKLPIKWLALESMHDGIFSEKSDVWSFGVTCWEIFNGGKTPYPGIHPADLPIQLDQGLRLEKPNNAAVADEIYSIMASCWISQSYRRPSFSELVNQLSSLLGDVAGYLDLKAPETLDTEL